MRDSGKRYSQFLPQFPDVTSSHSFGGALCARWATGNQAQKDVEAIGIGQRLEHFSETADFFDTMI